MNTRHPKNPGAAQLERWLIFAFGVIFCSVLLYLGTVVQNPAPVTIRIYVTVLSLAAAGVGALIPGFIEFRYKNVLRAGGAICLGVLVYANEPAIGTSIPKYVEPTSSPMPVVTAFLQAIDSGRAADSWARLADLARQQVGNSETAWAELYRNDITPLGATKSRSLVGQTQLTSPPGAPPGLYRLFTYKSTHAAESGVRLEQVAVRANAEKNWEVYSYTIAPTAQP